MAHDAGVMEEELLADKSDKAGMKTSTKVIATLAAGAAAAAAGYYFFYGSKNAKKNRQVVAQWATDFKADVIRQARHLKEVNKQSLAAIIDGVTRAYSSIRSIDKEDLMRLADELKDHWQMLKSEVQMNTKNKRSKKKATRSRKS